MAKKRQSGLGKGLDSLIPDFYDEDFDSNNSMSLEDMLNDDSDSETNEVELDESEEVQMIEEEPAAEEEIPEEIEVAEEIPQEEDVAEAVEEEAPEETEIVEEAAEDTPDEVVAEQTDEEVVVEEDIAEEVEEIVEEPEEEILTEREMENIEEVKEIVDKNPRITLWSSQSAAVFRYLRKTEPEFSISKEASILIDEAVSKKYPEIWKLFE